MFDSSLDSTPGDLIMYLETMYSGEQLLQVLVDIDGLENKLRQEVDLDVNNVNDFMAFLSPGRLMAALIKSTVTNKDDLAIAARARGLFPEQFAEGMSALTDNDVSRYIEYLESKPELVQPEHMDVLRDFGTISPPVSESVNKVLQTVETLRQAQARAQKAKADTVAEQTLRDQLDASVKAFETIAGDIKNKKPDTDSNRRTIYYDRFDLGLSSRLLFKKPLNRLNQKELASLRVYLNEIKRKTILDNSLDSMPVSSGDGYTTFVLKAGEQRDRRVLLIQTETRLVIAMDIVGHNNLGGGAHDKYRDIFAGQVPDLLTKIKTDTDQAGPSTPETGSDSDGASAERPLAPKSQKPHKPDPKNGKPKRSRTKNRPVKSATVPVRVPTADSEKPRPVSVVTHQTLLAESQKILGSGAKELNPMIYGQKSMTTKTSGYAYGIFLGGRVFDDFKEPKSKTREGLQKQKECQSDLEKIRSTIEAPIKKVAQEMSGLIDLKLATREKSGYIQVTKTPDITGKSIDDLIKLRADLDKVDQKIEWLIKKDEIIWSECPVFKTYLLQLRADIQTAREALKDGLEGLQIEHIKEHGYKSTETYDALGISFELVVKHASVTDYQEVMTYYQKVKYAPLAKTTFSKVMDVDRFGGNTNPQDHILAYLELMIELDLDFTEDHISEIALALNLVLDENLILAITKVLSEKQSILKSLLLSEDLIHPDFIGMFLGTLDMSKGPYVEYVNTAISRLKETDVHPSDLLLICLMNRYSKKGIYQDAREYCKVYRRRISTLSYAIVDEDGQALLDLFESAAQGRMKNLGLRAGAIAVLYVLGQKFIEEYSGEVYSHTNLSYALLGLAAIPQLWTLQSPKPALKKTEEKPKTD